MNEQLKKLYEKEFDKKILKSKFTQEEIEKISAPFLLSIEEEKYLQAKTKMLYIGKETNKWWGKLKHFIEFDNSIDILRQRYRVEFDGGKVLASNKKGNGDGYTSYKKEDWASNAFFSKFNYIKGDSEGFVNIPLTIKNVCFSCFLREDTEKPMIKISLRSVGSFPCNQLAAEFFHGGGHLNASGGEFFGTMEEAKAVFEKALEKYKPLLTAKS